MKIAEMVYELIKCRDDVTYADLEDIFDILKIKWEGSNEIVSGENENVIFWTGWSEEAIEIVNYLQREGFLEKKLGSFLHYLLIGKIMLIPVVREFREYKTPHWLPLAFTVNKNAIKDNQGIYEPMIF